MAWAVRDQTCVVGIGETEYTRWGRIERSEFQIACEAILKALDDAGLSVKDLDGFVTYSMDRNMPVDLARAIGVPRIRFSNLYTGGGNSTTGIVQNGSIAVFSETANVVACYRSLAQGQFGRFGQSRAPGAAMVPGVGAFSAPFGLLNPAASLAMQFRRHMYQYGTTSRQLGHISVACYKHAQRNPRAVMYGRPITIEDHQNSRLIAEPYHLYDCCLETDGAAAVIVTSVERARSCKQRPVYIMGAAQGCGPQEGFTSPNKPARNYTSSSFVEVAEDLWHRAGIGPKDVDVAQFYENFTGQVLMAIEDLGFCKRGEGGGFVEDGRIEWPDGELPLNTSGGNLAEAYTHGLEMVVEGVRQMRGTSTCQVEGAEIGLVVSGPGAPPVSTMVLRR